jgi:hypothetical protein
MQTASVSFCFRRATVFSASVVLALAAAVACGGSEVQGGNGAEPGSSAGSTTASSAGSSSNPASNPGPSQGSAPSNGGQASSPLAPSPAPSNPSPSAGEGGSRPASIDATGISAACGELDTNDACGACVCSECGDTLDACAATPGCPEILACVRENACSGTDCFCGDATLTRCFAGEGDGPCKDAVLAAPGGREPTLSDPSGGPASDAALAVGECAEDDDGCADVCDVGL